MRQSCANLSAEASTSDSEITCDLLGFLRADARTRTADPFITSEVLYQLSYVGAPRIVGAAGYSGALCNLARLRASRHAAR